MVDFKQMKLDSSCPAYLQVAEYVERLIYLKIAVNGDPLPSRRQIAAQIRLNPNTVQKACRYMEEQAYVKTEGNHVSVIHVTPKIYEKIQKKMTLELCRTFVEDARKNGLSYKKAIALISELWEE